MRLPNQTFLQHNIMEVLAENCTGMDDHDDEDCGKCAAMEDQLVKAVAVWYAMLKREPKRGTPRKGDNGCFPRST